jgi:hypothetical protein
MGRRRSEGRPPKIPEDLRQDYDRYSGRLRRANWEAADLLISLFHVCSDAQQSLWCCRQLRAKLEQIKVWLPACEEIVAHASEWRPRAVEYVFLPPSPCKACVKKAQSAEGSLRSVQPPEQEVDKGEEVTPEAIVDSSWGREVDLLLRLARTTTQQVTESAAFASTTVGETFKCLNDLIKLLLRQQRHVTFMGSTPIHVSWRKERNCQQCGQEWTDPRQPDPDVNPEASSPHTTGQSG